MSTAFAVGLSPAPVITFNDRSELVSIEVDERDAASSTVGALA